MECLIPGMLRELSRRWDDLNLGVPWGGSGSGARLALGRHLAPWESWLPLLLVIGGGLFIAVAGLVVFWLLRRIGRPDHASQLRGGGDDHERGSEAVGSAPLDVGTILHSGRFEVLRVREQHNILTVYEIRDLEADQYCQICGSRYPNPDAMRCPTCDAVIHHGEPTQLLAAETLDSEAFAAAERLHTLTFHHSSVILPIAVFSESSQGALRYYYVRSDVELRTSTEIDPPQPPDLVMGWGISLAHGLAALHRSGLVFRSITPEQISIHEEDARWLCCENLVLIDGASGDEIDRAFAADVRGVGRWMLLQMTGDTSLGPDLSLPEPLSLLLSDVLMATYPMSAQQLVEQLDQIRRQIVSRKDIRLWIGARSDTGRIRELNEDSIWTADYSDAFSSLGVTVGAFAVADGVGGHAAGDVASQLTVDVLQRYGDELRRIGEMGELPEARTWLKQAAEAANHRVHQERQDVSNDMGSTLVMALFIGNEFAVLNVGDSRAYRLGLQGLQQISVDHTLVERLVSIGQITRDEAKLHPRRNVIYRVMGGRAELEYDCFDGRLAEGEALLLCSDGLTDMLTDHVLWQIWRDTPSPQAACDQMVDEANQLGGHDNITVIIVQVTTMQNQDE